MQMKRNFLALQLLGATLFMLSSFASLAQTSEKIIGQWKDKNHPEKQVEMYKQGTSYFGKTINDQRAVSKNGTLVFKELVWNEQTKTYKGILINPDNPKEEFKIDIALVGENQFQFKVGKFIFGKSFTFIRIR